MTHPADPGFKGATPATRETSQAAAVIASERAPKMPGEFFPVPHSGPGEVRVRLDTEKGAPVVDIRHFDAVGPGAVKMSTKRGATLPITSLPALSVAVSQALARAKETGWLPKGDE
jgi:hypothetical protein